MARLARWLETRPEGNRNFPLFYAAKVAASQGLLDDAARQELLHASLRSGLRGGEREARRTLASGERAAAYDRGTRGSGRSHADHRLPLGPVREGDQAQFTDPGIDQPQREAG